MTPSPSSPNPQLIRNKYLHFRLPTNHLHEPGFPSQLNGNPNPDAIDSQTSSSRKLPCQHSARSHSGIRPPALNTIQRRTSLSHVAPSCRTTGLRRTGLEITRKTPRRNSQDLQHSKIGWTLTRKALDEMALSVTVWVGYVELCAVLDGKRLGQADVISFTKKLCFIRKAIGVSGVLFLLY